MAYYKLAIYGQPAVGKSVFALGWDNPFFICTDGNYDFLEDFGAKPENHVQVHDWNEFKTFIKDFDFNKYDTLVVDLIEDLYQWCTWDFCKKNHIDDLGDFGGFGKGYNMVANIFIPYIDTIINRSKNLIILTHEDATPRRTNRGVDYMEYQPSSLLRQKIWERISGKLRFCFRAYLDETQDDKGKYIRKRLLSISPKPHEYQINRGMNVDDLPESINLTYKDFCNVFGKPTQNTTQQTQQTERAVKKVVETKPVETKVETKVEKPKIEETKVETKVETKPIETKVEEPKVETTNEVNNSPKKLSKEDTKARILEIRKKLGLKEGN